MFQGRGEDGASGGARDQGAELAALRVVAEFRRHALLFITLGDNGRAHLDLEILHPLCQRIEFATLFVGEFVDRQRAR